MCHAVILLFWMYLKVLSQMEDVIKWGVYVR